MELSCYISDPGVMQDLFMSQHQDNFVIAIGRSKPILIFDSLTVRLIMCVLVLFLSAVILF
jgi:hypothetical protein